MITRVELHHFKNYGPHTVVDLCQHPGRQFAVVIGRNGSGKSSFVDGIVWCLFQSRASTIRARNVKSLVNRESPSGRMHVIVYITHPSTGILILFKREFNGHRMSTTVDSIPPDGLSVLGHCRSLDKSNLWNSLLDECNIPSLDRILVEQNKATVASDTPLSLLAFIERAVGTDALRIDIESCNAQRLEALMKAQSMENDLSALYKRKRHIVPGLMHIQSMYKAREALDRRWIAYLRKQMQSCEELLSEADCVVSRERSIMVTLDEELTRLERNLEESEELTEAAVKSYHYAKRELHKLEKTVKGLVGQEQAEERKLNEMRLELKALKRQLTSRRAALRKHSNQVTSTTATLVQLQEHSSTLQAQQTTYAEKVEACLVSQCVGSSLSEVREVLTVHCMDTEPITVDCKGGTLLETKGLCAPSSVPASASTGAMTTGLTTEAMSPSKLKLCASTPTITICAQIQSAICAEEALLDRLHQEERDRTAQLETLRQQYAQTEKELEIHKRQKTAGDNQCEVWKRQVEALSVTVGDIERDLTLRHSRLIYSKRENALCRKYDKCVNLMHDITHSRPGVVGMLIDCITVKSEQYVTPLLAVAGPSLAETIVVETRDDAIFVSAACRRHGIFDVIIDIVDEMQGSDAVGDAGTGESTSRRPSRSDLVDLLGCIVCPRVGVRRVMQRKLQSWVLFTGKSHHPSKIHTLNSSTGRSTGKGDIESESGMSAALKSLCHARHTDSSESSRSRRSYKRVKNMVTLSGRKFLRDGEIRAESSGTGVGGKGAGGFYSPTGMLGRLLLRKASATAATKQSTMTLAREHVHPSIDDTSTISLKQQLDDLRIDRDKLSNAIAEWETDGRKVIDNALAHHSTGLRQLQSEIDRICGNDHDTSCQGEKRISIAAITASLVSSRQMLIDAQEEEATLCAERKMRLRFLHRVLGKDNCEAVVAAQRYCNELKLQLTMLQAEERTNQDMLKQSSGRVATSRTQILTIERNITNCRDSIDSGEKSLVSVAESIERVSDEIRASEIALSEASTAVNTHRDTKRKVSLERKRVSNKRALCLERQVSGQKQRELYISQKIHHETELDKMSSQLSTHAKELHELGGFIRNFLAPTTQPPAASPPTDMEDAIQESKTHQSLNNGTGRRRKRASPRVSGAAVRHDLDDDEFNSDDDSKSNGSDNYGDIIGGGGSKPNSESKQEGRRRTRRRRVAKRQGHNRLPHPKNGRINRPVGAKREVNEFGDDDDDDDDNEEESQSGGEKSRGALDGRSLDVSTEEDDDQSEGFTCDDECMLNKEEKKWSSQQQERSEMQRTLDEAKALYEAEKHLNVDILSSQSHAAELYKQSIAVHHLRVDRLLVALEAISVQLESTYRFLVPNGECLLKYPTDSVCLFKEGVCVCARAIDGAGAGMGSSEGGKFWEARHLSGGQQAACGLALLLAVQHCHPSPLYLMDEIDASLDTATARRVGQLLCARTKGTGGDICADPDFDESSPNQQLDCPQFIIISHRPEVQEAANQIIGLYRRCGHPAPCVSNFA